jgi:hypothetical protein
MLEIEVDTECVDPLRGIACIVNAAQQYVLVVCADFWVVAAVVGESVEVLYVEVNAYILYLRLLY